MQGHHHARFHDPNVVYHVLWRTFQGRMLLTPSDELNDIAAGVVARAQDVFKNVRLYALAFLTNHCHLMLQGPADQLPAFIGYVKRELSRRWGRAVNWPGTLWSDTYYSTALPTQESQRHCFAYVLAQGVKEGLVAAPEQWPGLHIAHYVIKGRALQGGWLDGTAYGKALFKDRRRNTPAGVAKEHYIEQLTVRIDTLPCWQGLAAEQIQSEIAAMRASVIAEGEQGRDGAAPISIEKLRARNFDEHRQLPKPPWWQERRRLICWSHSKAIATREYLKHYWEFQRSFRHASDRWMRNELPATFPAASFRPGRFERCILAATG